MAEPVSVPPGVGIVHAPASAKPRRFVSTSTDGLSGYWTTKSDEELAADEVAAKAQHDALVAQSLRLHPTIAAERQAEREAAQQAAWNQQWPNPRQSLRAAHETLCAAAASLAQHRDHAASAKAHLTEREVGVERAQSEVETVRKAQTDRLKDRLAGNGDPVPDGDDPAEAAAMRDAERARRLLAVARSALSDIEAEVETAGGEVRRAQTRVEAAAAAVITKAQQSVEAELTVAQQRVAELQAQLSALRVDHRYGSANWRPNLRRLLTDPEAPLIEAEIKSAVAPEPETA
jgi:hypothetical protein